MARFWLFLVEGQQFKIYWLKNCTQPSWHVEFQSSDLHYRWGVDGEIKFLVHPWLQYDIGMPMHCTDTHLQWCHCGRTMYCSHWIFLRHYNLRWDTLKHWRMQRNAMDAPQLQTPPRCNFQNLIWFNPTRCLGKELPNNRLVPPLHISAWVILDPPFDQLRWWDKNICKRIVIKLNSYDNKFYLWFIHQSLSLHSIINPLKIWWDSVVVVKN